MEEGRLGARSLRFRVLGSGLVRAWFQVEGLGFGVSLRLGFSFGLRLRIQGSSLKGFVGFCRVRTRASAVSRATAFQVRLVFRDA